MKKFLLFLVVAISAVSLGLTIYYFSADNEVIYIKTSYIVCEVGDTISTDDLLAFEHKDENTKISYGVEAGNNVLSFKSGDEYYRADNGGSGSIIITTTNRSFPKLVINVLVCDGSREFPFILNTEEELNLIGKDEKYPSSAVYKLNSDIVLTENENGNWIPASNFNGILDGNFHTISNIHITNQTLASGSVTGNAGFVGSLQNQGVIKNLYLDNIKIEVSGIDNIGIVAGTNEGLIQAVQARGSIISNGSVVYLGGIAGINKAGKIDRCGFEGDLIFKNSVNDQLGGGIAALNLYGIISESYYRAVNGGLLQNDAAKFGGIVGYNKGEADKKANLYDNYFYMSTFSDEFNATNIGGVLYNDFNGNLKNVVLGNYYGGDFAESAVKIHNGSFLEINTRANGYLTKLNFVKQDSFVNSIFKNNSKRLWNFETVWEMGTLYPVLNSSFVSGSTYPKDTEDIIGDDIIVSAQELYDKLNNADEKASYTIVGSKIDNVSVIDFKSVSWVWGDKEHPIPTQFNGTLTCENGCVIKNLKIINNVDNANVGLVGKLGYKANIRNIKFENVQIIGNKAKNVGVLAGENNGALIENISLNNVEFDLEAENLGGLVGLNSYNSNGEILQNSIDKFTITNLKSVNKVSLNAGGVAGVNEGIITNSESKYNLVKDINLLAISAGGAIGYNKRVGTASEAAKTGILNYVTVQDFIFNSFENTKLDHRSSTVFLIGGAVGENSKGAIISQVKTRTDIKVKSLDNKAFVIGGIAGWNFGQIMNAEAINPFIYSTDIYSVIAGGIAGINGEFSSKPTGMIDSKITGCVVSEGEIDTKPYNVAGEGILSTKYGSVVGGIAGIDGTRYFEAPSIENCFVNINKITGRIVAGVVGITGGRVYNNGVGSYDRLGGNVVLNGCVVGGITAINDSMSKVKHCFTFTTLESSFEGKYENGKSIVALNVSPKAGMTVVHKNGALLESCFAVCEFGGKYNGINASTVMRNLFKWGDGSISMGETKRLVFQTIADTPIKVEANEIHLTKEEFQSNVFFSNIADNVTSAKEVWYLSSETGYPALNTLKNI